MLGKLTWNAIPWDQPIPLIAGAAVFMILLAVVAWIIVERAIFRISGASG